MIGVFGKTVTITPTPSTTTASAASKIGVNAAPGGTLNG